MSSYHPRIFRKTSQQKNDTVQKEVKHNIIPEHTLYEEPLLVQKRTNRKYITVFGFSQGNLENVLKKIKEEIVVGNIEYGKNWINIMVDGEENTSKLLRLNTCYVNGEIIGVFRESSGVIEDKDIFSEETWTIWSIDDLSFWRLIMRYFVDSIKFYKFQHGMK